MSKICDRKWIAGKTGGGSFGPFANMGIPGVGFTECRRSLLKIFFEKKAFPDTKCLKQHDFQRVPFGEGFYAPTRDFSGPLRDRFGNGSYLVRDSLGNASGRLRVGFGNPSMPLREFPEELPKNARRTLEEIPKKISARQEESTRL